MKVWVTKYWDTKGIYEANGRTPSPEDRYVYVPSQKGSTIDTQVVLGKTAFVEKADAKARVLLLRDKKLAALRKQIAKLEKMKL